MKGLSKYRYDETFAGEDGILRLSQLQNSEFRNNPVKLSPMQSLWPIKFI